MPFHYGEKKATNRNSLVIPICKTSQLIIPTIEILLSNRKKRNAIPEGEGELTSLSCMALVLARTTSGESVMLVNLSCSGRVRYKRSLRSSWAFLALTTSTEPSVSQPMPRSHSRSDLYTFCKQTKGYWHGRDSFAQRAAGLSGHGDVQDQSG